MCPTNLGKNESILTHLKMYLKMLTAVVVGVWMCNYILQFYEDVIT